MSFLSAFLFITLFANVWLVSISCMTTFPIPIYFFRPVHLSLDLTTALFKVLPWPHEASTVLMKLFTDSVLEEIFTLGACGTPSADWKILVDQKCQVLEISAREKSPKEGPGLHNEIKKFVHEAISLVDKYRKESFLPPNDPDILKFVKFSAELYRLGLLYRSVAFPLYYEHIILIQSEPSAHFFLRNIDTILRFYLLDATAPSVSGKEVLNPLSNEPTDLRNALVCYERALLGGISLLENILSASENINNAAVFFDSIKNNCKFSKNIKSLKNLVPFCKELEGKLRLLFENPIMDKYSRQFPETIYISNSFDSSFHRELNIRILSCFWYYMPKFVVDFQTALKSEAFSALILPLGQQSLDVISAAMKPIQLFHLEFQDAIIVIMAIKDKLQHVRNSAVVLNDPNVIKLYSYTNLLAAFGSTLSSKMCHPKVVIDDRFFPRVTEVSDIIEDPSLLGTLIIQPNINDILVFTIMMHQDFFKDIFLYENENFPSSVSANFRRRACFYRNDFPAKILGTLNPDTRFFYTDISFFGRELIVHGVLMNCQSELLIKKGKELVDSTIHELTAQYYNGRFPSYEDFERHIIQLSDNFATVCECYATRYDYSVLSQEVFRQILNPFDVDHKSAMIIESKITITDRTDLPLLMQVDLAYLKKLNFESLEALQTLIHFAYWHQKNSYFFPLIFKKPLGFEFVRTLPSFTGVTLDARNLETPIWSDYLGSLSKSLAKHPDPNLQEFYDYIVSGKNSALLTRERKLNNHLKAKKRLHVDLMESHFDLMNSLLELEPLERLENIYENNDYYKVSTDVLDLLALN